MRALGDGRAAEELAAGLAADLAVHEHPEARADFVERCQAPPT